MYRADRPPLYWPDSGDDPIRPALNHTKPQGLSNVIILKGQTCPTCSECWIVREDYLGPVRNGIVDESGHRGLLLAYRHGLPDRSRYVERAGINDSSDFDVSG